MAKAFAPLLLIRLMLAAVVLAAGLGAVRPVGPPVLPSPHDDEHLVIFQPEQFRVADGSPAPRVKVDVAPEYVGYAAQPVALAEPVTARFEVGHAGQYVAWVRLGQSHPHQTPVKVTLSRLAADGWQQVSTKTVNKGLGAPGAGGAAGRRAYEDRAKTATPAGAAAHLDSAMAMPGGGAGGGDDLGLGGGGDALGAMIGDMQKGTEDEWTKLDRLDRVDPAYPFYWWNIAGAQLQPGTYQLEFTPVNTTTAPLLVDAAFLSTETKLVYPWLGDVNFVPATFVRFRLDELPAGGAGIKATIQTHNVMAHTLSAYFGPAGLDDMTPLTKTGYTPWYRLQDIDNMPPFRPQVTGYRGRVEITLEHVAPPALRAPVTGVTGATEFAIYPHADHVLRSFAFNEPAGTGFVVPLDPKTNLHLLNSFRDAARGHYKQALTATEDKLFPLTRDPLIMTNTRGSAYEQDRDYVLKTIRLLGFNSVAERVDPLQYRRNYGGHSWTGGAAIESFMPFDEDAAEAFYQDEYGDYTQRKPELYEDMPIRTMVDEPGERLRTEMSGPIWLYAENDGEPTWRDPVGGSALHTRENTLTGAVLEGEIARDGGYLEFRVGIDDPRAPTQYWYWRIARRIGPGWDNMMYGKWEPDVEHRPGYQWLKSVGTAEGKLAFKVIFQSGSAMLFINGEGVHTLRDLPKQGGLGIAGDVKTIYSLNLRTLRGDESIGAAAALSLDNDRAPQINLGELDEDSLPQWARPLPLKEVVPARFVYHGGVPGAHEGFRKWLAKKGLTPQEFGAEKWEDVRMLTLPHLVQNEYDARRYYWGRRYSGYLTPHMFYLAAKGFSSPQAVNPQMRNIVALSGGTMTYGHEMSLDMFQLGSYGPPLVPGISDWIFYSNWRRDGHHQVAYHVAPYNAAARRYDGRPPLDFPMMHCVFPSKYRAYTELANQVKTFSFYSFGPLYTNIGDSWSEIPRSYDAISAVTNRASQFDDIVSPGIMRRSRVAMLYSHSTEYWASPRSYGDKLSTFLALAHEYYQPELITEDQVLHENALSNYDAVYVLEPYVHADVQAKLGAWVKEGGLLWACADSFRRDQYDRPRDLLNELIGLEREFAHEPQLSLDGYDLRGHPIPNPEPGPVVRPVGDDVQLRPHSVIRDGLPSAVSAPGAKVRAVYDNDVPAWVEQSVGKGKVVYVGHRVGWTHRDKRIMEPGYPTVWADTGRAMLTQPLHEAGVDRDLILSQPTVMAQPLTSEAGTALILYNMRPGPTRDLNIRLRVPAEPSSVHIFDGLTAKAVEYQYEDGWVSVTLPELVEEQMLVVRQRPMAEDARWEEIRTRTAGQLQSAEWEDVSAGAWFAGFDPDGGFAEQLPPLLKNERWEIRRTAAESLRRLKHTSAGPALVAAANVESDPHARAEMLLAAGALGEPGAMALLQQDAAHPHAIVREAAYEAIADVLAGASGAQAGDVSTLAALAKQGVVDPDLRIRSAAAVVLARTDADAALDHVLALYERDDHAAELEQARWTEVFAEEDALFDAYAARSFAGPRDLAVAVGAYRRHPHLAKEAAEAMLAAKENAAGRPPVTALLHQRDPEAATILFDRRGELSAAVRGYLPLVLEHTFARGLGSVMADWEQYMSTR